MKNNSIVRGTNEDCATVWYDQYGSMQHIHFCFTQNIWPFIRPTRQDRYDGVGVRSPFTKSRNVLELRAVEADVHASLLVVACSALLSVAGTKIRRHVVFVMRLF